MTKNNSRGTFRPSCLAALLAAAFSPTYAQVQNAPAIDPERLSAIADLAAVASEARLGLGLVSKDNRRFGQYSGMRDEGAYAIADVNYRTLDKESGSWLTVDGRNLGLDSRELSFDHYRQGQARYQLGFSQTVRYEPMVVNTGLSGIGSTQQAVNGMAVRPVDFAMKRELLSLGFDHSLGGANAVRLRYTHEDKDGERLFGRGATGVTTNPALPNAYGIEFLAEPIHRNTQTLELSLSHAGKAFQLSGGYYGTLFLNYAERLDVQSTSTNALNNTVNGIPVFSPMSMPLSNDSHQLFLTGAYSLSPMTRLSFKSSYTVARQNENIIAVTHQTPPPAGAPTTLDGRVVTTLGYLDLTSLEIDRLDLQANIRYEDRDDKTPQAQYLNTTAPSATLAGFNGFNKPRSWRSVKSKLEAGYQLPLGFKLVGGWELDQQKRNVPEPQRRVAFRAETDEETGRLEVKRMIAESATGSVSYSQARRTGSDYVTDTYNPVSGDVNPLLWADRERDTWRATIDWAPLDELSLRFSADQSDDRYSGRVMGPREGGRNYYSLDASYSLSNRWQATLFLSRDDTKARQRTHTGAGPTQQWEAKLRQLGDAAGIGVRGKLRNGLELGGELNHYRDHAEQRMSALVDGFALTSLPDYTYRLTELKLFGSYPLQTNSGVRLDYVYQDWKTDDWTWNGWTYSDGTNLSQDNAQRTHFLGASYYYRWR